MNANQWVVVAMAVIFIPIVFYSLYRLCKDFPGPDEFPNTPFV
jgi:hypothetical protein